MSEKGKPGTPKKPGIFSLLAPYKGLIILLLLFALLSNGLNLWLPKLVADGIDDYTHQRFDLRATLIEFTVAVIFIFVFGYLQGIIQTYASEKVARDLRTKLSDKISRQSHAFIEQTTAAKLLTNLTADIDSIKLFVSQAIVAIVSSLFIILGASVLLLSINWKLALAILVIIPIIGGMFAITLKKVRTLFVQSREVIDWLNKIINESILGSALIRVVNSQQAEYAKFLEANTKAKGFGLAILNLFAGLIPVVTFTANLSMLTILVLGGHFVIEGDMTLGSFAAFNSYLALLIFPILVIGFMSNVIAQSTASYGRVSAVLNIPDPVEGGSSREPLKGHIELRGVTLAYGGKPALKDVSLSIGPGSKIAVIGPTAAGKTQLLYLLTGLIAPQEGSVTFDGHPIGYYDSEAFHRQVGFVFQDSTIFNMSIRENIAFSATVTDDLLEKAVQTAELASFIESLPNGLDTVVSERGTSLSGGQKQRIMLARALAVNPKILLLDDFTARVDTSTEKKILENVERNYPGITLISVTQKIAAIEHYDQIAVLMEGELIGCGTHDELMRTSPEYVQIYHSQQSTSNYEVRS